MSTKRSEYSVEKAKVHIAFVLPLLGKHPRKFPGMTDFLIGDPREASMRGRLYIQTTINPNCCEACEAGARVYRELPEYEAEYRIASKKGVMFVLKVAERWQADLDVLLEHALNGSRPGQRVHELLSEDYLTRIDQVFPELAGTLPWHEAGRVAGALA